MTTLSPVANLTRARVVWIGLFLLSQGIPGAEACATFALDAYVAFWTTYAKLAWIYSVLISYSLDAFKADLRFVGIATVYSTVWMLRAITCAALWIMVGYYGTDLCGHELAAYLLRRGG